MQTRVYVLLLLALVSPVPVRAAEEGTIRKLTGQRLTLFTDVPSSPEVDALPSVFDQATPQWCEYFGVDPKTIADWRVTGYLIVSRERFEAAGLVSRDLRKFKNGFALTKELWLYDQSSPYYRRHLLLHEGAHALMNTIYGGLGPPWYCEGMAEILGTHRLDGGKLTLNYFPRAAAEVPRLGRIEIVQKGVASGNALSLAQVLGYDVKAHLDNDAYGWSWALAAFLDGHPRYRARFRALPGHMRTDEVRSEFRRVYEPEAALLSEEWRIFTANLEYGYDFERMQLDVRPAQPLAKEGVEVTVAADRGWQPSGIHVEAGKTYRLKASGRYQVANGPRPWPCEPGGVTIRYYHGQPLGILLAAVRSDKFDPAADGLHQPHVIGLSGTLVPKTAGALYLRINDSAAELEDNAGTVQVVVSGQ